MRLPAAGRRVPSDSRQSHKPRTYRIFAHQFHNLEIIAEDLAYVVEKGNYSYPKSPRKPDPPRNWGGGVLVVLRWRGGMGRRPARA